MNLAMILFLTRRSYAYYIEVSVDQKDWVRVIDHSNYFCRSWQNLYFEPRVVQYIKLVGTSNTVNKVLYQRSEEKIATLKFFQFKMFVQVLWKALKKFYDQRWQNCNLYLCIFCFFIVFISWKVCQYPKEMDTSSF